jgi:uncharacterized membrane protein YbhN (UPF0104 family)
VTGGEVQASQHGERSQSAHAPRKRQALTAAKGQLGKKALKLLGYVVVAYLIVRLVPGLKQALKSLQQVRWQWVVAAVALEILSESGFVVSWRAIVDPEDILRSEGGGELATRAAWAQLGGGMLVPGGTLSTVGVGAWILHRFGMPAKLIAERQFNLSFLNTAVDALALIIFGLGLAVGVFGGAESLALTLLPAAVAAIGLVGALFVARRAAAYVARAPGKHPKIAAAITALARAVDDTRRLLSHRRGLPAVLGAVAYLGFDVLMLWSAFSAIHARPLPSFAVVLMAYIIGALGGSIPLPAGVGAVGGQVGMLILYGVGHNEAVAAVILYQAVGQLVPLIGGGIAYLLLRHELGPIRGDTSASRAQWAGSEGKDP